MTVRLAVIAAVVGSLFPSAAAPAVAATEPVEYRRAVSYWYIPTKVENIYRLYKLDVVTTQNLATGATRADARFVTDKCERTPTEDGEVLYCDLAYKERSSDSADIDLSTDLSSAVVTVGFGHDTYVVHFKARRRSMGLFAKGRMCSQTERQEVAGVTSNMDVVRGRLPGRKLTGVYTPTLDHAWLERGYGAWC